MNRIGKQLAVGLSLALIGLPAAAFADGTLFFSGDMVISPPKGAAGAHCVLSSQFLHNDEVVFRVRVLDQTGAAVTDKDLKSLEVQLSSGETFKMRYGGHPHDKPLDSFWAVGWKIPADYPAGSISYKVVATTEQGDTQTWQPFNVAPSQLTVLQGTDEGSEETN
jgi:hypothetical protein